MSYRSERNVATNNDSVSASIPGSDSLAHSENRAQPGSHDLELCAICGQAGAREWLRAPDRLHGRQENYTLVRCPNCSLVWLSHPPKPAEMHLHYTAEYHKLISAGGGKSAKWSQRKADLARFKQSGTLLDLGCSSGSFLESMRGESWKLFGIEMSADTAREARAKSGAEVFVGDILDAPFPAGSFDVITCFDVLEHVYEPRQVVERVATLLKPGGIYYFQVPNIASAEARVFGTYWQGLELPRHLFHYSPASLRILAKTTGLQVAMLETRQNPAVGTALRYIGDDLFRAVGIRRTAFAYRDEASLPWRAARKLVRMTVLRALLAVAPVFGEGEAIHAIFMKDSSGSGSELR
jgi:SAM-dependent methyltransferase